MPAGPLRDRTRGWPESLGTKSAADNTQFRFEACWGLPRFACYCQLSALHQESEVGYPGRAPPSLATITTMRQPTHRVGVRLNPGALIAAGNVGYSRNTGKHFLTASFSRFDPDRTSTSLARSTVDRRSMALSYPSAAKNGIEGLRSSAWLALSHDAACQGRVN